MLCVACQQSPVPTVELQVSVTPRPPSGVKIPFTTVENVQLASAEKHYKSEIPGIIVVSDAADIDKVRQYVSEEAYTQLAKLDFTTHFAVITFQGLKGSLEYMISVQDITRNGNDVFIYARLDEPAPDMAKAAAVTSPYSLVIAEKEGIQQRDIHYHLIGDGLEIATFSD